MNRMRYPTILAVLVALQGCVLMSPKPGEGLESQIDNWIVEREYGNALDALSRLDPKSQEYTRFAERRRQVEGLASKYEKDVVAIARKDVAEGKWAAALDAYDRALDRLPNSSVLRDGLAALHRQQAALVAEQELELLISRATWLETSLPYYEKIAAVTPRDYEAKRRLEDHRAALASAANHLGKTGIAALDAGEIGTADRTLPLAARLSDAHFIQEGLKRLNSWHAERKRVQKAARQRRLAEAKAREDAKKRRFTELRQEYQNAIDAGQLINARTILKSLGRMAPEDKGLAEEQRQLDQAIQNEANRLFEEGVRLYSRGEFEQAAHNWRRVLELIPDHQAATENLERAERVLERVQQLRDKQARPVIRPTHLNS